MPGVIPRTTDNNAGGNAGRDGNKSRSVGRRGVWALMLALVASMALAACDSAPTATPVTNQQATATTSAPTTPTQGVSAATATPTTLPFVSATPVPPTRTPTIKPSPTPTATPTDAPLPAYTWKSLGLPDRTNMRDVEVLPGNKNVVLLGSPQGIWKSEYDYSVWNKLDIKIPGNPPPGNIEMSIASADVYYVSAHTGCASGLPITSYRSADGGTTWSEMPVQLLDMYAASATMAYGTTCAGVVKTTDSGATWSGVLPGSQEVNSDPYAITGSPDGKSIYVAYASEGGTGTIKRSTDSGATWKDVTPKKVPPDELLHAAVHMMFVPGSTGRPQDGGLYMANQQGTFFLPLETDNWDSHIDTANAVDAPSYYVTAFYVDTDYSEDYVKPGPILYEARARLGDQAFEGLGVFRSVNLGATWQQVGDDLGKRPVQALVLAPHDTIAVPGMLETLIAATSDGAWAVTLQRLR
jgi:photosystem II stability/assembly factor-like uncharacterized protein